MRGQLKGYSILEGLNKLRLILTVLAAPVVLLTIVLYPLVLRFNFERYTQHYRLPKNFTKTNIELAVRQMRQDTEYQFYFKILGPESIARAAHEAYKILDKNRGQSQYLQQITALKNMIQSRAILLHNSHYPADFTQNPLAYPDLIRELWDFLDDEFQLTILGLCYKATYDLKFRFQWDETVLQSAQKIEGVFYSFTAEQRKQIEQSLLILKGE